MARAKKARRASRGPKNIAAPPALVPEQEGNAASRALLGVDDGRGAADAEPEGNGSVEDPLQDWPESEGEPDQWLDERGGQSVEDEREKT